jgi:hypothetical protein
LSCLLACGSGCPDDKIIPRLEKRPGPPALDSLHLTTHNDTQPGVRLFFSDTNLLEVSFNAQRTDAGGTVFFPVEGGQGIPKIYRNSLGLPCSALPDSCDSVYVFDDLRFFDGLSLQRDIAVYRYRLFAVSRSESLSVPSNTLELKWSRPAVIQGVDLSAGYPVVQYELDAPYGAEWDVEIVLRDTVRAWNHHDQTFGTVTRTEAFPGLPVDVLKTQNAGANGTFGVRILSVMGAGYRGLAVASFNVFQ